MLANSGQQHFEEHCGFTSSGSRQVCVVPFFPDQKFWVSWDRTLHDEIDHWQSVSEKQRAWIEWRWRAECRTRTMHVRWFEKNGAGCALDFCFEQRSSNNYVLSLSCTPTGSTAKKPAKLQHASHTYENTVQMWSSFHHRRWTHWWPKHVGVNYQKVHQPHGANRVCNSISDCRCIGSHALPGRDLLTKITIVTSEALSATWTIKHGINYILLALEVSFNDFTA